MSDLPAAWQRDFDVYDRIEELGIDLKSKEDVIPAPSGRRICMLTFTPAGLLFTSGTGGGRGAITNDDGGPWVTAVTYQSVSIQKTTN